MSSQNQCVDVTECPARETVAATDIAVRWDVWHDTGCFSGCRFDQCTSETAVRDAESVPCCVKKEDHRANRCPSRATVLVTRKEQRWSLWEDSYCTTGCKLNGCGKEGEAEVPCCVKESPFNDKMQVLTLPLPVVAFHDYTVKILREITTPVVKPLGYTFANSFRISNDGSITNTANGLQVGPTPCPRP